MLKEMRDDTRTFYLSLIYTQYDIHMLTKKYKGTSQASNSDRDPTSNPNSSKHQPFHTTLGDSSMDYANYNISKDISNQPEDARSMALLANVLIEKVKRASHSDHHQHHELNEASISCKYLHQIISYRIHWLCSSINNYITHF